MWPFWSLGWRRLVHPGIHPKERDYVLDRLEGCVLLDPSIQNQDRSSLCSEQKDSLIQSSNLWSFFSTPGLHQGVCSGSKVGTSEGHSSVLLSGRLPSYHQLSAPSCGASRSASTKVARSGDYHQLGEVIPRANLKGSDRQMSIWEKSDRCITATTSSGEGSCQFVFFKSY